MELLNTYMYRRTYSFYTNYTFEVHRVAGKDEDKLAGKAAYDPDSTMHAMERVGTFPSRQAGVLTSSRKKLKGSLAVAVSGARNLIVVKNYRPSQKRRKEIPNLSRVLFFLPETVAYLYTITVISYQVCFLINKDILSQRF